MADVGERIRSFPALGEIRNHVHWRIVRHQVRKNKAVEMSGVSVRSDARVEVGWRGLDNKSYGARISCRMKMRASGWKEEGGAREREQPSAQFSARVHAPASQGWRSVLRLSRTVNCSCARGRTRMRERQRPKLPWLRALFQATR